MAGLDQRRIAAEVARRRPEMFYQSNQEIWAVPIAPTAAGMEMYEVA